ncbi:hypothetical protein [Pseudoruegeria sp. HB172150]|uniref:hypothetical protein n=1 Tax=Pseudoruegeria sp. HB172150 TaxID=2721164 RepID=UPI0015573DAA|nr:hypothetical protein [Pseudoruegeria sp. HB172150]
MPIVSNLRPSSIGTLSFAFDRSARQVGFAAPVMGWEIRLCTKGIFGLDLSRRDRGRMARDALCTGALFGLSAYL